MIEKGMNVGRLVNAQRKGLTNFKRLVGSQRMQGTLALREEARMALTLKSSKLAHWKKNQKDLNPQTRPLILTTGQPDD
jgi:hypothetical protein